MTLGNSVFGIFKTIFDILLKIKKFAFLEYYKTLSSDFGNLKQKQRK